jgi:hypothetical protein
VSRRPFFANRIIKRPRRPSFVTSIMRASAAFAVFTTDTGLLALVRRGSLLVVSMAVA